MLEPHLHLMALRSLDAPTTATPTGDERALPCVWVVPMPVQWLRWAFGASLLNDRPHWQHALRTSSVLVNLHQHPDRPAQTIMGDETHTWGDLAEGLPTYLAQAGQLVVMGLERMLDETPHRLLAFLNTHARQRPVVVITTQADRLCALPWRWGRFHVEPSVSHLSHLTWAVRSAVHRAWQAHPTSDARSVRGVPDGSSLLQLVDVQP